jgi:hypothetical protein
MNYKIVDVFEPTGFSRKHVISYSEDAVISFPADESNTDFMAFIESNPDALNEANN